MKKTAIVTTQFDLEMFQVKLTVEELVEFTYVDTFNSEKETGYQRPVNKLHVRKIVSYFLRNDKPIMASSILGAVNCAYIDFDSDLNQISLNSKIRIVDGQHRIEAFRQLKSRYEDDYLKIKDVELPTIILAIKKDQEIHEINTFIDLNSKGKKVSTDLAIRLRSKVRNEKNEYNDIQEIEEEIAAQISRKINCKPDSVWYEGIKVSPEQLGRPISLNAFCKSLNPLIKSYCIHNNIQPGKVDKLLIDDSSIELLELISSAWEFVWQKWNECFESGIVKTNKMYSIQKGLGVNSLHLVLYKCYLLANKEVDQALDQFRRVIYNSSIDAYAWKSGGKFSAYSSSAGYKELSELIMEHNI